MAWVFDLDGVIWVGDDAVPGAAEAVAAVRAAGETVAFVTNNSFGRRADVAERLRRHGVDPGDDVVTSAMAVAGLVTAEERVLVCGGPGLSEELEARGAEVVACRDVVAAAPTATPAGVLHALADVGPFDAVVVGYHRDFDYLRMTVATRAVAEGARLLASNDDATYPTGAGPIPGGGSIVAAVATASGRMPTVAGKPHEPIAALVRRRLGPEGIVVGDRPDTDGRFAETLGYRFGLVLSGVTSAADLPVHPTPAVVAADLAALVQEALATPEG
ncbi:MAG: HAD-IIA family hydrolase [Acidimicrobiales bacterium]|nr:HAD-IIA family hydrolase [Acidimicrobiales bacterium]